MHEIHSFRRKHEKHWREMQIKKVTASSMAEVIETKWVTDNKGEEIDIK